MKKLNLVLIIEGVLLIAVAVLFILFFTKNTSASPEAAEGISETGDVPVAGNGETVFVSVDSLIQNYQFAIDLTAELEETTKKLDAELSNRQRKFQTDVTDFQNKAQKGLETRAKLAEMEQQLGLDQQNIYQLGEQYRMQIAEERMVMERKVLQAVMDYLKEYNKSKGYQYIMGSTFDYNMLYASPANDITKSVLEGLNAKYNAEKPSKK
jgi:outer membrane protein